MKNITEKLSLKGSYLVECIDADGRVKWTDKIHNLVVNAGKEYALDAALLDGSKITSWYAGLTGATPTPAAADTLASHGGWTEFSDYSGSRIAWSASRTAQTVSNSTQMEFTMTAGGTVGGAFLCSVATGTSGTLFSCGAFSSGNRTVVTSDVIRLTYQVAA